MVAMYRSIRKWNVNVKLALIFSFASSAARGVWAFTTLSVYLKMLSGTVGMVGVAEGAQGICQCLAALVGGMFADHHGRDMVLHVSGFIGLAACAMIVYLLLDKDEEMTDHLRLILMTVALSVMGSFQGISTTCIDTLFADSVKTGQRTKFNTFRFILTQISSITGPIICVVLFLIYGNEWTYSRLTHVFAVGIILNAFPIFLLFLMSDEHSLGKDSESHHIPSTPGGFAYQRLVDDVLEAEGIGARSARITARSYEPEGEVRQQRSRSFEGGNFDSNVDDEFMRHRPADVQARLNRQSNVTIVRSCGCFYQQHIPSLLLFSDFVSGLGSGMSVKFYPLFFKQQLHLDPVSINCIYILLPIFMTVVALAAQHLAKAVGRAQVASILNYVSCITLCALGGVGRFSNLEDWKVIIPIYFLSTAQHCTRPLKKAILMDYVPKAQRARYNSIDSINRFGWSGSALFGGFSVDKYGFGRLFLVTAAIQLISSLIFSILTGLVPREETAVIEQEESLLGDEDEANYSDSDADSDTGVRRSTSHSRQETAVQSGFPTTPFIR